MPVTETCGFCAHYEQIEGIFGTCSKKKDTTFSSNPICEAFEHKHGTGEEQATPSPLDLGGRHAINPKVLAFMGMALPPGFMPQHVHPHQQEAVKEPEEWINPVVRRKHTPRKVINLAEEAAKRNKK